MELKKVQAFFYNMSYCCIAILSKSMENPSNDGKPF